MVSTCISLATQFGTYRHDFGRIITKCMCTFIVIFNLTYEMTITFYDNNIRPKLLSRRIWFIMSQCSWIKGDIISIKYFLPINAMTGRF